jgi:hypothetical protein
MNRITGRRGTGQSWIYTVQFIGEVGMRESNEGIMESAPDRETYTVGGLCRELLLCVSFHGYRVSINIPTSGECIRMELRERFQWNTLSRTG